MLLDILAGRISAVNREFVYIDFDDERFPPCEGGEEVTEGASGRGKERRRKEGHNHLRFEPKNMIEEALRPGAAAPEWFQLANGSMFGGGIRLRAMCLNHYDAKHLC